MGEKNNHPTEKAALYQKRFVAISEPEKNSQLKEARVKELTGDRTITARRMHEDFWSFQRTHTFWISTNHLPKITGTDEGIWRRVKLIPFAVDLRQKVKPIADFDRWLVKHEGPGILAWLVRGYLDYREHGLTEPSCVTKATAVYRNDSDALGEFLRDFCVQEDGAEETQKNLFRDYSELHRGKWTPTLFGRAMAERFKKDRPANGPNRNKTVYRGVRLKTEADKVAEQDDPIKDGENIECAQLRTLRLVPQDFPTHIPNDQPNYAQPCAPAVSNLETPSEQYGSEVEL